MDPDRAAGCGCRALCEVIRVIVMNVELHFLFPRSVHVGHVVMIGYRAICLGLKCAPRCDVDCNDVWMIFLLIIPCKVGVIPLVYEIR